MVDLRATLLASVITVVCLGAIAGTGVAYAQQSTSSCGASAYQFVACGPALPTAQMYGAVLVGGIVALSAGFGIAGRHNHTPP